MLGMAMPNVWVAGRRRFEFAGYNDFMASPVSSSAPTSDDRRERLRSLIHWAAELLPSQGPITSFVFLNTLQALEDLPFDEGLKRGARLFGCQAYLTEDVYRQKLAQNRILDTDLAAVLEADLKNSGEYRIAGLTTRRELRLAMLLHPLRMGPKSELQWFVDETDALSKVRSDAPVGARQRLIEQTRVWVMRDLARNPDATRGKSTSRLEHRVLLSMAALIDQFGASTMEHWPEAKWEEFSLRALWRICRDGVHTADAPTPVVYHPVRHRDLVMSLVDVDTDALVHPLLIRFCAAFLDQGFADWPLPQRESGFFASFLAMYRQPLGPPEMWQRGLAAELARVADSRQSPIESVLESLEQLGVPENEWKDFLVASLLALRGWAGMIWQNEVRGDRVALAAQPGSLIEFLAVRLLLERVALAYVSRQHAPLRGDLAGLRDRAWNANPPPPPNGLDQRAFLLFQLAQLLEWTPAELYRLKRPEWNELVEEVESFSGERRRRLFHIAYERRVHTLALDALAVHTQRVPERIKSPRFQIITCIDAREESFRRHLEEQFPDTETFATAGFFGIPIYYKGVADAHFIPLCPIVVKPQFWLTEEVVLNLEQEHRRKAAQRKAIGSAQQQIHFGSRSIALGALLTASVGVLASVPLVARVLFPRLTARLTKRASAFVAPPRITRLHMERIGAKAGPTENGIGFSIDEMANLAERALRDIGLTSGFARIVFLLGHGSHCLNNPHRSAYDCGACSGGAGGPNARALASMLNDHRVRKLLHERGLDIPDATVFVGGLHNTCNDSITYFDIDLLPATHAHDFIRARDDLEQVCERNAHERCRRFQSAPLDMTFTAAHQHVEGRAEDLAETRPEYGNASNIMCFVGRRARTRGLYLDRRSFLMSYDPAQDDAQATILARILGAVIPVCEGINLQYTFSAIDNVGWGCGTKLPHNIVSLLGVMDGAASDLRPGLPFQGVEIHEPVRLLFVLETTPEAITGIMDRNPTVGRILRNGWSLLALLDPHTAQLRVFRDGQFVDYVPQSTHVPTTPSSLDWYRGWRDHLEFAILESAQLASS